ncbi:MAG: Coenzyme F420 hydrogenase/dehydrogenase, beta subunit C-terminal domain [Pseudomonadota bacterium]
MRKPETISEVVENGLCIGCGLCEFLAEKLTMHWEDGNVLRPIGEVTAQEQEKILQACPGAVVSANLEKDASLDLVWGAWHKLIMAWSAEPEVRHQASTGGVLTALGRYALKSGIAEFVLHAGPHKTEPLLSDWVISETPEEVLANSGSRYAPVAVLAGLRKALSRQEPFVIIAKPCDANAVRRLALEDERIDRFCKGIFVMVCGGASELAKTKDAVTLAGASSNRVAAFRYRGFGNPGPHRITMKDGSHKDISYNEMWGDETGWRLQSRCKICPDPIGEAADIAASDCWPGGSPSGEDEGFNGVIVRTKKGIDMFNSAVGATMIETGRPLTPDDFSQWQPHQVRKSIAIQARLSGLAEAGQPVPELVDLRKQLLSENNSNHDREKLGSKERAQLGKFREASRITVSDVPQTCH